MTRKRHRGRRPAHRNLPHQNRIRVRGKRRTPVDETNLTLAYWLLAKQVIEDRIDQRLPSEDEVQRAAEQLDSDVPDRETRS